MKCLRASHRAIGARRRAYRGGRASLAADAFWRNNRDGTLAPHMQDSLDLILVRRPKPYAEIDRPFSEVYVGIDGKTEAIDAYLATITRTRTTSTSRRVSRSSPRRKVHGERAGDILLVAQQQPAITRSTREQRYYFAEPYHSWHGSPSKRDSEILPA